MIPLRDSVHTHLNPLVTHLLVGANGLVFLLMLASSDPDLLISRYALIAVNVDLASLESLAPFITSQFLHAGWMHLISNMWFLHIFGDNVEENLGHIRYLFLYLLSGVIGGFVQYLFLVNSEIPMLGASGAVAGILGAYFVYFPYHKIETLVPLGFFMTTVNLPASVILVYWFVTQLFSGVGSIYAAADIGGVAFWAHIGGFLVGYLFAKFTKN